MAPRVVVCPCLGCIFYKKLWMTTGHLPLAKITVESHSHRIDHAHWNLVGGGSWMRRKGRQARWPTGISGQAGAERVEGRRDGEKVEGKHTRWRCCDRSSEEGSGLWNLAFLTNGAEIIALSVGKEPLPHQPPLSPALPSMFGFRAKGVELRSV